MVDNAGTGAGDYGAILFSIGIGIDSHTFLAFDRILDVKSECGRWEARTHSMGARSRLRTCVRNSFSTRRFGPYRHRCSIAPKCEHTYLEHDAILVSVCVGIDSYLCFLRLHP